MFRHALLCTAAALALSACNRNDAADAPANEAAAVDDAAGASANADIAPQGEGSSAAIVDGAGATVGSVAYVNGDPRGLPLTIKVEGLQAGVHGMHLHEVGTCEGPKFESAGAHWNPAGRQHGHDNPQGAHAGDLGNITVAADGTGSASHLVPKDAGAHPRGLALVVHAERDDAKTDPSGNSGDRIACGVVIPAPS